MSGTPFREMQGDLGRVPMLMQDRQYLLDDPGGVLLVRPTTYVDVRDGRLRDGPVSDRVAVVSKSGAARHAPARLLPPVDAKRILSYELDETILDVDSPDAQRFEDDAFVQLHVFACAHATLAFFEQLLGRRVRWAFPAKRLELVPWSDGADGNAAYERESARIAFERYGSQSGRRILLALSRDIVAHETGHAIVDAVAPDLYDACDPDSLTLHETYGDLSALLQTLLDEDMLFSAYALFDGDVDPFEALGRLAEEFGTDLRHSEGAAALRSATADAAFDAANGHTVIVDRSDPHDGSAVVVAALFAALRERVASSGRDFERGVLTAARELARIVVPALNRLPAGEVSLLDFGRALGSAARETAGESLWMKAVARQFAERGIVEAATALDVPRLSGDPLAGWPSTPAKLVKANRERLGIPDDASPVAASVEFHDRAWSTSPRRRVQLRAHWEFEESHDVGYGFADRWCFRAGTTAVVDADSGVPVSIVTGTIGEGWARRDEQLRRWERDGLLLEFARPVPDDEGGTQIAGTARALHLLRPDKQRRRKTTKRRRPR